MEARAGSAQTAVKFSSEELKVCSYVYKPPDTHTTIPGVMVFEHTLLSVTETAHGHAQMES